MKLKMTLNFKTKKKLFCISCSLKEQRTYRKFYIQNLMHNSILTENWEVIVSIHSYFFSLWKILKHYWFCFCWKFQYCDTNWREYIKFVNETNCAHRKTKIPKVSTAYGNPSKKCPLIFLSIQCNSYYHILVQLKKKQINSTCESQISATKKKKRVKS